VALGPAEIMISAPDHDAADQDAADQVGGELRAALLELPLRQRQVVGLRVFLDLDTARTAQVLGIAPGTVTAHLARAIAALRESALLTQEKETQ
jgi:DNA-directed RNA polymerase specialized sigma24 family protein